MRKVRSGYKIFVGKPERKRVLARLRLRFENNAETG
jgi:hypothetical protein